MINKLPDEFDLKDGKIPYSPWEQLEKVNKIIKYLKERENNRE